MDEPFQVATVNKTFKNDKPKLLDDKAMRPDKILRKSFCTPLDSPIVNKLHKIEKRSLSP